MDERVVMPVLGETMQEGTIIEWHKKEGDWVSKGDILFSVETDKTVVEVEALRSGYLQKIVYRAGATVPVQAVVAYLVERLSGPGVSEQEPARNAGKATEVPDPHRTVSAPAPQAGSAGRHPTEDQTVKASPAARRLAREYGIDLGQLRGSGPGGRIQAEDVETFVGRKMERAQAAETEVHLGAEPEAFTRIPLTRMRREIASLTAASFSTTPHFFVSRRVQMDVFQQCLAEYNQRAGKTTVTDGIVKAVALALREHPSLNVSFQGDHLRQYHEVNVGVAMALEDGLRIPVVHGADRLSPREIHQKLQDVRARIEAGRTRMQDLSGATFTVSNLGMYGVHGFAAVIYPPNAAVLAVGGLTEQVSLQDGAVCLSKVMDLTVSGDHRAVDGVDVARFLQTLSEFILSPDLIFAADDRE